MNMTNSIALGFAALLVASPAAAEDLTYSLVDINPASGTPGQAISPGTFSGKVTLNYFGSQC